MAGSEGVLLRPAKGRIVAGLLLVTASGSAFALPRVLVRAQPRSQAERPPAALPTPREPVKIVRVSPSLVTTTLSPSFLSVAQHAPRKPVLAIPQRGAALP